MSRLDRVNKYHEVIVYRKKNIDTALYDFINNTNLKKSKLNKFLSGLLSIKNYKTYKSLNILIKCLSDQTKIWLKVIDFYLYNVLKK